MSTPATEGGLLSGSTAATASTQTLIAYQHTPWKEPAAVTQIAKKARSWRGGKTPKKSWPQYPSRASTPPPNLSFKELCSNYPNHLCDELLLEMSDAGLKPRDIVEMMPADTRNSHLGTEWSWLTERTRKAKLARDNGQGPVREVTSVESEGASQPTGQGTLVTVEDSSHNNGQGGFVRAEDSNLAASYAPTLDTATKPIRETAAPIADDRASSSFNAVSTFKPTTGRLDSKTTVAMMTPEATHSDSSFGAPRLAAPTQTGWQLPLAVIQQNNRAPLTASPCPAAVIPPAIDRPTATGTVIVEGNQFAFQPSPPKMTPPSQYTTEYRRKEGLREEIRKHLSLLVDISSTDEAFVSRSQQQQQNDILLQWKKWCDEKSYHLGKQHRVFVGPTLTGFVVKDSLTRLLGTLTMINMKHDENGRAMVEEIARSRALEYTEALFKQYTWDLEARANQLFPATAESVLAAQPINSNNPNVSGQRYGYYGVELSRAALKITQQSPEKAADHATDEQHFPRPYLPPEDRNICMSTSLKRVTHVLLVRTLNGDAIEFYLPAVSASGPKRVATT